MRAEEVDTGNRYIRVTDTFGVEGERSEIEADAKRMTIALARLIRDTSRNVRTYRDDTQLQFVHEVAHALIADLEAVTEAVEVDRKKDQRKAAQKVIAAKLAAWKAAIVVTRSKP